MRDNTKNPVEEYQTVRDEQLARFRIVFDGTRYGVSGFFALIAFQFLLNSDQFGGAPIPAVLFAILLQALVLVVGFWAYNEYTRIYMLGSFLKIFWEQDRMGLITVMRSELPGTLWGTDSRATSLVLLILTVVNAANFAISGGSILDPSLAKTLWLAMIGFTFYILYLLAIGMGLFKDKVEEEFRKHFKKGL